MREIKFRYWDAQLEKMVSWEKILKDEYGFIILTDIYPDRIFMQFTGLLDRNGKEIYEGDIVQVPGAIRAQIYWDFGSWQLRNGSLTGGMVANFESEDIEILGNIYENPALTVKA